jgi:hypothetical protein
LEGDDVVPLGAVLPVAVFVFDAVGGGDGEPRDVEAAGSGLHLRVFAEVAEKSDLVDALCHENRSYLVRSATNLGRGKDNRKRGCGFLEEYSRADWSEQRVGERGPSTPAAQKQRRLRSG